MQELKLLEGHRYKVVICSTRGLASDSVIQYQQPHLKFYF